jgi:hypothetical protein
MQVLTINTPPINRWNKDSIRPGPVGSVGDVNMEVQLRKSAPDMANRYDRTFSGKNEVWSGSNVSDGMYQGYTSGGRGAIVVDKKFYETKANVGWMMQNIVPVDRTRNVKMTPLGRYGWDTLTGSVVKAKVTGDMFLPRTQGYASTSLTRGSQYPTIVATSVGQGVPLPAADVDITNPIFGETGVIKGCTLLDTQAVWAPAMDDPRRKNTANDEFFKSYPYRKAKPYTPEKPIPGWLPTEYPEIAENVYLFDKTVGKDGMQRGYRWVRVSPCGTIARDPFLPAPQIGDRPMPGNQDKRREEEKNKKQKMR